MRASRPRPNSSTTCSSARSSVAGVRAPHHRFAWAWRFIALGLFAGAAGCYEYQSAVPLFAEGAGPRDPALAGRWDVYANGEDGGWVTEQSGGARALPPFLFLPLDGTAYYVGLRVPPAEGQDAEAWHFVGTCGAFGDIRILQLRTLGFEKRDETDVNDREADPVYRFVRYAFTANGELTLRLMLKDVFKREDTAPHSTDALHAFVAAHLADPALFEEEATFRLRPFPTPDAGAEDSGAASAPASMPAGDAADPST